MDKHEITVGVVLKTGTKTWIRKEGNTPAKCLLGAMNELVRYDVDRVVSITRSVVPEEHVPEKNDVEESIYLLEHDLEKMRDILARQTKQIDRLWDMIRQMSRE